MKCPNCGKEMGEGHLYCENCGEDIHIVPDFEPELELNMVQSMEQILEDVAQTGGQDGTDTDKESAQQKTANHGGRFRTIIGWGAIGFLVVAFIIGGIGIYRHYSLDYQTNRARQAVKNQKYDRAIQCYTRAMELDRFNVSLKFELAEVYFLKNDKDEYEYWLLNIVSDPNTDSEQLESAYGKLIAIYRAKEDYQMINDMLLECQSESIRAAYQNYMAEAPQFSIPAGDYDTVKALKLTVTGKGNIYYTVNGGIPDESSDSYTTPILLENGDYIIQAVFVNENGVSSDIASAEYHIMVDELEAPEISVDSGEYDTPVNIIVLNDTENVYYTTDGTTPTMDSTLYTEPIPMPLGVSTFSFARLETGRNSVTVERSFTLELDTDITPEQAVDKVRENALQSGKIRDNEGHFDDTNAHYVYQYLCVTNIEDINAFYVVAEVIVDAQGNAARTGNYFAINAYTGNYYKLQTDNGTYNLVEM